MTCYPISETNPSIHAIYQDFTGWMNGRNGAIFERIGKVSVQNFKTCDNALAGIEFSLSEKIDDGSA